MSFFHDPTSHPPRAPSNPRLLKALSTASASTDLSARNGLYEALMNSVVLIPTSVPVADAGRIEPKKQFIVVEDERGVPAVPVFSDLQALQRWAPGSTGFISLPVVQFLREAFPPHAGGLWINIADRAARFVSRSELSHVTSGLISPSYARQIENEVLPVHGDFDPELNTTLPAQTVARIVACVAREQDVAQAYLMELTPRPRGKRLVVGLRTVRLLEEAQVEQLLRRVARLINARRLHRGGIDVILLDFARHRVVAARMPPIYERGTPMAI
jgi:hypothetical protein